MSIPSDISVNQRTNGGAVVSALPWLALGFALLLAMIILGNVTMSGLKEALASIPVWGYLLIALIQALVILLAAQKWCLILRATASGKNLLGLRDAVAATTLGALFGQVLPIQLSTPVARAWIARRYDISAKRAVGTSVFEQVFEVLVLISMGAIAFAAQIVTASFGAVIVAMLFCMVALTALIRPALRLAHATTQRVAGWFSGPPPPPVSTLTEGYGKAASLSYGLLLQLTGLSFARYALMAALNVGILYLLVPHVSPVTLLLAYPAVLLLMSLPIFPGGLGVVELTWVGILLAQGVGAETAAENALSLRIVSTFGFLLVAPGLLALVTATRRTT